MSPQIVLIVVLGVLLAVSTAGNAWQYKAHDAAIEAAATATQLNRDTAAAAGACSAGVDNLAKASAVRGAKLAKLIGGNASQIQTLQAAAQDALAAKPSDPNDLCASAVKYAQDQIRKERAGAPQ